MYLKRSDGRPAVIAHRGFSAKAPENTLVAIELAIAAGAHMVEVDVGFSADDHLVLIHDEDLDRTTSGRGPVRSHSLASLRSFDAGAWFAPEFAGESIPLLEEALDRVRGRIPINLEIKADSVDPRLDELSPRGIEARTLEAVRERDMFEQVLFSSFHPLALWRLRRFEPAAKTASLRHAAHHSGRKPREILDEVGSTSLHVADAELDETMIADCHAEGIPLRVYTVNDAERFLELAALGIDAVFTDDPASLLRAAKFP